MSLASSPPWPNAESRCGWARIALSLRVYKMHACRRSSLPMPALRAWPVRVDSDSGSWDGRRRASERGVVLWCTAMFGVMILPTPSMSQCECVCLCDASQCVSYALLSPTRFL